MKIFGKEICFHNFKEALWYATEYKQAGERMFKCTKCGKEIYIKIDDHSWKDDIFLYYHI